ncbi:unnamed protein product [Symbiodinium microadriaticum]|nr:unnamed protein product [Symbiodinium microadriaticum]
MPSSRRIAVADPTIWAGLDLVRFQSLVTQASTTPTTTTRSLQSAPSEQWPFQRLLATSHGKNSVMPGGGWSWRMEPS